MSLKKTSAVDRHIGQRLRLQRINLGMSQEALGGASILHSNKFKNMKKG